MKNVLYVDADTRMSSLISRVCEVTDIFSVYTVESQSRALEWLTEKNADLIVSNHRTGELNGVELLRRIRRQGLSIPFIFFSEENGSSVKNAAYYLDAFGFIERNGYGKKQILDLLRLMFWTVGRHDMDDLPEKTD